MKALLPYLTGGGDVVRGQMWGYDDQPGLSLRAELVIDAASTPPRQIYWKDLSLLVGGDVRELLGVRTATRRSPRYAGHA